VAQLVDEDDEADPEHGEEDVGKVSVLGMGLSGTRSSRDAMGRVRSTFEAVL
jgi:hypothetical protein